MKVSWGDPDSATNLSNIVSNIEQNLDEGRILGLSEDLWMKDYAPVAHWRGAMSGKRYETLWTTS